jgi:outer membrane protein OmpA-like peptidoglycan-associated protein
MKTYFFAFIFLILVACFSPLFSQQGSFGLKGGGSMYFGDVKDQRAVPASGVVLDLWLKERFGAGLAGFFSQLKGESDTYYFENEVISLSGLLKLRPFGKTKVSPYLQGGIEYFHINPTNKIQEPLPNNHNNLYKRDRIGAPVGGGLAFFVAERISFDLEGMYHFAFTDYLDDLPAGKKVDNYVVTSLGISFHFGKLKDTDGDGIADKYDLDPLHPEDFDGYRDSDGAPDPDNDEDGVPDIRDKEPLLPEDHDGFEDEDGVPDTDNDQDGILDVDDQAPNEKEDVDSFQDLDGAPDPDNDQDGIADEKDLCPGTDQTVQQGENTAETFNGYEDDDGCPDKKPEIAVEKGESIVLEGVYFATGRADLTENSRMILDKVVRTLMENPGIEVEIRGHTDNTGSYQTNMRLSKARADAVKLYLINHGIDAARIRTNGYGPDKPIAPNSTREGRAKNRRIEFYRLK